MNIYKLIIENINILNETTVSADVQEPEVKIGDVVDRRLKRNNKKCKRRRRGSAKPEKNDCEE